MKKIRPKTTSKVKVFMKERRLTVSVGTSADYGKAKVGIALSENIKEDADSMEIADTIYDSLVEKLEEKFDDLCEKVGLDDDSGDDQNEDDDFGDDDSGDDQNEDDDSGDDDQNEDDENENDEDLTEDDIKKMKKKELLQVIADEELEDEVDPKEFKKINDLRAAIIDALFEDDENEDDEFDDDEFDDDEWGDDD